MDWRGCCSSRRSCAPGTILRAGNGRRRWRRWSRKWRRVISAWLPKLRYPIREGEHDQTAFAFGLIWDWAEVTRQLDDDRSCCRTKAGEFYQRDRACPLNYEPSGQDFLSPCLAEADFMRRVLEPQEFAAWLDGLPAADRARRIDRLAPAGRSDRSQRSETRASRRTQSQPRLDAGRHCAGTSGVRSAVALAARDGRTASRSVARQPSPESTTSAVTGLAPSRSTVRSQ